MKKIIFCYVIFIYSLISMGSVVFAAPYHVGPGDVLEISIWRDEELSRELIVPPDGVLSFPLIGDVDVNEMSVAQIRETIRQKLSEYVPEASVAVILKEINSLKVYVIGQVKNPGAFSITQETRVMQVLAQAQGLTPFASERDIHILRYMKGKTIKIDFDYKSILKGKNLDQDPILKRGDVIVVP
ncbi:periplasmic polysaccharide export protein [Desulfosarcina variabilis str. Montpellier]|uniref:polysaccharide biosynthesis/export family protein n=1 Tax=Desulfosarcina variabilis TaxID=2300 RepID=UPI003AFB1855